VSAKAGGTWSSSGTEGVATSPKTPNLDHRRQRNAGAYAKTRTEAMITLEMASSFGKVFSRKISSRSKERPAQNFPQRIEKATSAAGPKTGESLQRIEIEAGEGSNVFLTPGQTPGTLHKR